MSPLHTSLVDGRMHEVCQISQFLQFHANSFSSNQLSDLEGAKPAKTRAQEKQPILDANYSNGRDSVL
jgi:hypothetical protein